MYLLRSEAKYLLSIANKEHLKRLEQVCVTIEAEELEDDLVILTITFLNVVTKLVKINNLTLTPTTLGQSSKMNTITSEKENNSNSGRDAFISDSKQTHTYKDSKKKKKKSKGPFKSTRRVTALFKAY